MNEKFVLIDVKKVNSKKSNKVIYFAVIYSSLGYLVKVFLSKDDYDSLMLVQDIYHYDIENHLNKFYDDQNKNIKYLFVRNK